MLDTCIKEVVLSHFLRKIKFHKTNNFAVNAASGEPCSGFQLLVLSLVFGGQPPPQVLERPSGRRVSGDGQDPSCLPVTRSSAVLVACPDPLVALREYRPLLAFVTAGIVSLARPSLKEICTPGRVEVEITWPSLNQLTSGTGKPRKQRIHLYVWGTAKPSILSRYVHSLILNHKSDPECYAIP